MKEDGVDYNAKTKIICGEEGCEEPATLLTERPRVIESMKLMSVKGTKEGVMVQGKEKFLRRCRTHFEGRPEVQIYRRYWGSKVPRPNCIEVNSRG
ncbi:MAG: hypothetical protein V3T54_00340 [Acidobacteriota bacterium]